MATNGGDKTINHTCMVPEFGDPGWFDESALTNIHGLSEVLRGRHHVKFDSKKYNGFIVTSKSGSLMTFTCDDRGIYVKDPRPNEESCQNMVEGFTDREVKRKKNAGSYSTTLMRHPMRT